MKPLSRRDFLKVGSLAVLGTAGATTLTQVNHKDHNQTRALPPLQHDGQGHYGDLPGTVGEVDHQKNGFNPT
ncbi:MAG TPA: twin-arginine translocation signal domain-containing protein, partial [Anaerolineales bacterium]